ncbi:MAG: DUF58 domain-containing protein, partial [Gammaproteobacteria bacterium]
SGFKGRGMEFDETRPYQPGDDIRTIDWRVTARTGKTHTKLFREERERPVFISVDYNPSMQFATRGVFKAVQAAKLAALLAWSAQQRGDRIGGQIYYGQGCREMKPQNGKHAVLRFLNELAKPAEAAGGEATEYSHAIARLNRHVRPGSLVYLISDFRSIDHAAEGYLSKLSAHCDVILIEIHDPLESSLPEKGRYRFTDTRREVLVDASDPRKLSSYRRRYEQRRQALIALAKKLGLGLKECATDSDLLQFAGSLNQARRMA